MNRLPLEKRIQILQLLVEGNSLRSCARLANVSITTVTRLLVSVGKACLKFHSQTVVKIRSQHVQCDEIWSYIYAKQKNAHRAKKIAGDIWTWVAIDADTKLVISWYAGKRDVESARFFMNDLWCRLRTRTQLTTDGLAAYQEAVADTFGGRVDFAQLVKLYSDHSTDRDGKLDKRNRYVGADRVVISGNPNPAYISTSHVERQNLTMRTNIRRFTRETNAFSKKVENHCYAIALHFVYYNFIRIHKSLRATPAMAAGLTKSFMKLEELAKLPDIYQEI